MWSSKVNYWNLACNSNYYISYSILASSQTICTSSQLKLDKPVCVGHILLVATFIKVSLLVKQILSGVFNYREYSRMVYMAAKGYQG